MPSSKPDLSGVDEHLASGDFCERLCLAETAAAPPPPPPAAAAAAPGPGGEVTRLGLWPALRFGSHKELVDRVRSDVNGPTVNRLVAWLTVEYTRAVREARSSSSPVGGGVAYLLGGGPPGGASGSLAALPPGGPVDFFSHVEEMVAGEGRWCGAAGFRAAYDLAMDRMDKDVATSPARKGEDGGGGGGGATMHSVNSARKLWSSLEYSPYRKKGPAAPPRIAELQEEKEVEVEEQGEGRVEDKDEGGKGEKCKEEEGDDENEGGRGETRAVAGATTPRAQGRRSSLRRPSAGRAGGGGSPPLKTVEFPAEGPMSSPERSPGKSSPEKSYPSEESQAGCFHDSDDGDGDSDDGESEEASEGASGESPGGTGAVRSRSSRCSSAGLNSLLPWAEFWPAVKNQGWAWKKGDGLVEWIYIHPTCADMKKHDLLRDRVEGEDYFLSEAALQKYARVRLGWRGPAAAGRDSPSDADLAGRIKKRRRGARGRAGPVETEGGPAKPAEEPRKPAKSAKHAEEPREPKAKVARGKRQVDLAPKVKAQGKAPGKAPVRAKAPAKGVKRTARAAPAPPPREEPNSPESQGSTQSRFSEGFGEESCGASGASSPGGSRDPDSPTMSELEADLGMKSSKGRDGAKRLQFSRRRGDEPADDASDEASASTRSSPSSDSGSSGSSGSSCSSEDPTYSILADGDAFRLLHSKFGFSSNKNYYCFPGSQNKPGKGTEGVGYFATVDELRRHLCAYGLPPTKSKRGLEEEDAEALRRWVRYAHVTGLPRNTPIHPDDLEEPPSMRQAWSMLMKLGLSYTSTYIVPHWDPTKKPFRFDKADDYLVHLARFGIPKVEGINQNEVVSHEDRLRLDLFIADTKEVDAFKRIDPNSEGCAEITPRKTRRSRSTEALTEPKPVGSPAAPEEGWFRSELKELPTKRALRGRIIGSREALALLAECYGVCTPDEGACGYRLPDVGPSAGGGAAPGRDCFESVQALRKDLCARGLPPLAHGRRPSEEGATDLEVWIRTAHVEGLRDEGPVDIPKNVVGRRHAGQTRDVLKRLGYRFSSNHKCVVLPNVMFHKARSTERFDELIDLFNHIARFGLASSGPYLDCDEILDPDLLKEQKLRVQILAAELATNDIHKRMDCRVPQIMMKSPISKQTTTSAARCSAVGLNTTQEVDDQPALGKSDVNITPKHCTASDLPAVVVDEGDQDTPEQPSPPKKARTTMITQFFTNGAKKVVDAVAAKLSPSKELGAGPALADPKTAESGSPGASSQLSNMSPSCLDRKGDEEVEACFADSPECEKFLESAQQDPENCAAALKDQVDEMEGSQGQATTQENDAPNVPWTKMWAQMKKVGWKYSPGSGLVAFYYIHPEAAKMKKDEMRNTCTEGVHYFTTEHAVQKYAMDHLGWAGEEIGVDAFPSESSPTSRTRKRRQGLANESDAMPSPQKKNRSSESAGELVEGIPNKAPPQKTASSPRDRKIGAPETLHSGPPEQENDADNPSCQLKLCKAPPDLQPTIGAKLDYCQLVLHPSFKKDQLSKSASASNVRRNEGDIITFMKRSVETGSVVDGMTVPSPGFMYICGGPGTGKTTAVSSCASDTQAWAENNGHDKPCICSINMVRSKTWAKSDGIMKMMLKKMAVSCEIKEGSGCSTFEKKIKKKVFILVLDEIDMLFANHGAIAETWFKTLVDWAEDKEMRFSMIGISNCVNDVNATRVRELGHGPQELVFEPYREEDLIAILEQRVGTNIVDPKALQLISRRVAASSGDARRALEITSNAVGKCYDLLTQKLLNTAVQHDDPCMPVVKLPHMMRAIREAMPVRHGEVIGGLPQAAKVVLCIAVSLSQAWGPNAEISLSVLKKFCVEATHHSIMDELELGHIANLVEMLMDSGLLIAGNIADPEDVYPKIKIGVQLEDVEIALEESLLSVKGFYRSLVDFVKREYPNPRSF